MFRLSWWLAGQEKPEAREAAESLRERRRSGHLAQALQVDDPDLVHKVLGSMVLSEAVYKENEGEVVRFVQLTNGLLPWSLKANKMSELQFSSEWASQRCVVTESGGALFVCFRGTKVQRDFLTDLNVFWDPVFDNFEDEGEDTEGKQKLLFSKSETPCAHRGFLFRAKAVPILWFYRIAKKRKLKLVFTGHSLGGAVAALATVRLLHWLERGGKAAQSTNVSCIAFAAPAMGNLALQKYATRCHWDSLIYNYTLKEDFVPILMQPQKLLYRGWSKGRSNGGGGEDQQAKGSEAGDVQGATTADAEKGEGEDSKGEGEDSKGEGKTKLSSKGYTFQVVKFAVRLRRMVPIMAGRRNGKDAKVGNTFAYFGKQLTVLDNRVIPAALKNEVLSRYKELSEDVSEGTPRDAESSKRWNLVRWAVQSFEAHRMYSYREKILAACKLVPNVPDSEQVSLTRSVLPQVELNFGTVRLCKSLDSRKRGNTASVHITLAGRNLLSCKDFRMEAQGRSMKVDKYFSSKLDSKRASLWTKMRLAPEERLSFWEKAFVDSEEVLHLLLQVQLGSSLRWEDMLAGPLGANCKSDFQQTSSSLVVVPSHVRLSGRQLGYTHIVHRLLQHYNDVAAASEGDSDLESGGGVGGAREPGGEARVKVIDYSVLSTFEVIRSRVPGFGPAVTIEETSDTIVFVDTLDNWQGHRQPPSIPYGVKRAFKHGVESYLVLLRHQPLLRNLRESLSFSSSGNLSGVLAEGGGDGPVTREAEDLERRIKDAGFTNVLFLDEASSHAILSGSPEFLSPFALYNAVSRRGYGKFIDGLAGDANVMRQIKVIHDALHFGASTSQVPSPLLHRRTTTAMVATP
ncbi:alpha/beta fold hydrolase [Chloropicon primus]|uniref:Alpha/beta fold hydrolase n=1 Tax=Chloropicon primus TaxID=1764295 RepID=A0A5B8MNB4_9CHLO|nr:alpha/beta fold hydrolase [Chloropicon primus]UPR01233.1 alpha/beta fold hydrolase [Chloropicon primus]|eukprot:QDZ22013.1 alpha/beta fold hydrolase [Chloropicon primus]